MSESESIAVQELFDLATNSKYYLEIRVAAVKSLGTYISSDPRVANMLATIANNGKHYKEIRVAAAESLARGGNAKGL